MLVACLQFEQKHNCNAAVHVVWLDWSRCSCASTLTHSCKYILVSTLFFGVENTMLCALLFILPRSRPCIWKLAARPSMHRAARAVLWNHQGHCLLKACSAVKSRRQTTCLTAKADFLLDVRAEGRLCALKDINACTTVLLLEEKHRDDFALLVKQRSWLVA